MEYRRPPSSQDADMEEWQSLVVPLGGSVIVCAVCYFLGRNEYSFFWLLVIVIFNVVKSYLWKKRETRLASLRAARTREREVISAQLADLPAWVQFPDTERVEWLNKVIQQLWPYIGEYTKVFMTDIIVPQVKQQMPAMFKSFKFTKMDIGDTGCRVGGIKVYTHNVGRDRIIVDMDVAYAGDADFTISCCGFTGGMNQIQFSGKLRCILKPLLPYPPMVGGVSGTFLEMPKVDFNLTGMGEMVELPGLMTAIRTVVNSQIAAICVVPNEIVVPLAPDVDVTQLFFPEPNGLIRLRIIEARNLENRDISFIQKGKSDPYCEIQVGSQFFKTRTIDNDLNPVWNETFEAVVDVADGQHLRIECFDEDRGQDEELGRLNFPLSEIRDKGKVDKWFPLEGCKHGDIHIKASWFSLSTDPSHLEKEEWEAEWLQADKPVHSALLLVFIDNVSDLPYPKAKLEPSPFVKLTLGKQEQLTAVKTKTVNPLYQQRFQFFVKHPGGQELKIEAIDEGTKRSLGLLTLSLSHLMKEPKMEMYQTTLMLSLGVHQSPIVVTVRLRGLVPAKARPLDPSEIDDATLHHYATGSYIERANGEHWRGSGDIPQNGKNGNAIHSNGSTPVKKLMNESVMSERNGSMSSLASDHKKKKGIGKLFAKKEKNGSLDPGNAQRGELEMAIRYVDATNRLEVRLLRARYLRPISKEGRANPYVSCSLIQVDDGKTIEKKKTSTLTNTLEPVYDNHFEFAVARSDLANYKVGLKVKDQTNYGMMAKYPSIGNIEIRLDSLPNHQLSQQWVALLAERK
ncbi:hypothetical protein PENTCL1PPCAC_11427 [Pristionchus entomophagus]|uniref:Esyt-2 n=1 Tax=Pristionchus entomophagus TaxID=358040 RepID=A0AAV5T400_9BILA|nr:hypothetical protein PENTCL1PPCAC_11427 [Pristionchus entomophagus]